MKKTIIILVNLLMGYVLATAQSGVGTVVHSILEPAEFRQVNGPGWVLMDGGEDLKSTYAQTWNDTQLAAVSKLEKMPDARGMFLRGLNYGRDDEYADLNRKLATPQKDTIQSHSHFKYWLNVEGKIQENSVKGFYSSTHRAQGSELISQKDREGYYFNTGGSETRPNNLALYVYIKVN